MLIRRRKNFFLREVNNLPSTYKIMPAVDELTLNLLRSYLKLTLTKVEYRSIYRSRLFAGIAGEQRSNH